VSPIWFSEVRKVALAPQKAKSEFRN